jgi:anaerobic selenocysteine-containing dehydrogenase
MEVKVEEKVKKGETEHKISRRALLKSGAFLGAGYLLYSKLGSVLSGVAEAHTLEGMGIKPFAYNIQDAGNTIYSTCLQCHVDCQIKGKVLNGILAKIDGNPYSPQNLIPHINYSTDPEKAAKRDGKLCPKGLSGIQTLYDPYRIVKVLKRSGPRGSNRWKVISFSRAIEEIVQGGKIFKDVGEDRYVKGFKDIYVLKNPQLAKNMAEDVEKIRKKQMTVSEFKTKYRDNLNVLIDPDHPDLGPKNNQFVFMAGRIEHGRKELGKWFTHDSFASVNFFEHTAICEQSHHIAYKKVTGQFKNGKWHNGKEQLKPDLLNSEFVIFWGTGAFEANFGSNTMAAKVTKSLRERNFKYAVIDPRLSKTAAKAEYWLPVKPGTDGALALAMVRWIMENKRYDKRYLENANKASAQLDAEPTWTGATYLVKIEKNSRAAKLLRANEIGLGSKEQFVVRKGGVLLAVDPNDKTNSIEGDLFVDGEKQGIKFKSAFQLLKESASSKTLDEYSKVCGIEKELIIQVADEFTSYGKKAAIDLYRGAVQHTNGYCNAQAIITLNLLIGNPDWKGGLSAGGGHWHEWGGKAGSRYNMKKLHPDKLKAFGVPITREKIKYEESTLFNGYPAKRPWYPLTGDVYQEIIPSADDSYPYPLKILLLHQGTPTLSTPAGNRFIEILKDTNKIPLFITDDIVIGETAMYADYIFPDLTFLERWGTPHVTPDIITKTSKVRQPIVAPLTEEVEIDGFKIPMSMEAILITIAKKLGLSGFGRDGFGKEMDFDKPEDFYLKLVANIAFGDKKNEAVPDANDDEINIFLKAREHLPKSIFDVGRFKKTLRADEFKKVVYILNRGGRFEGSEKAYKGEYLAHQFKSMFNIYCENVAQHRNSMTGKYFSGVPVFEPIRDARGNFVKDEEYEFHLITFKEIFGGHSRTISNYWSNIALLPENEIWINRRDALRLGLKEKDYVRVVSSSNPQGIIDLKNGEIMELKAKAKIIEGIRPGVLVISWHYGHWNWYGSHPDIVVDGERIKSDLRRSKGVVPNPLMRIDDSLGNVCLTDPIGGSASFNDTKINIAKL